MNSPPNKNESSPDGITRQTYEVTPDGSLGLLALGAAGIKLWRKKRDEAKKINGSTAADKPKKENE